MGEVDEVVFVVVLCLTQYQTPEQDRGKGRQYDHNVQKVLDSSEKYDRGGQTTTGLTRWRGEMDSVSATSKTSSSIHIGRHCFTYTLSPCSFLSWASFFCFSGTWAAKVSWRVVTDCVAEVVAWVVGRSSCRVDVDRRRGY